MQSENGTVRGGRALAELEVIEDIATRILKHDPDPVVRYRLLRDVLRRPIDSTELCHAKMNLSTSRWVQELASEQWSDGSWGRFHTMDTKVKQRIPTTEVGVTRALALGLDISHPVLQQAAHYITCILDGTLTWRDWQEVSWGQSWWDTGMQLISASTLAQIQPDLSIIDDVWTFWYTILHRAFPSGKYDRDQEIQAHIELRGITQISTYAKNRIKRGGALSTFNKYHVTLLGSRADQLPQQLEHVYLVRIWDQGIGYLGVPLKLSPLHLLQKRSHFEAWLSSIELLTCFRSWRILISSLIRWLWEQRNGEGFWDFGPRSPLSTSFPLSESWRRKDARAFDWTTRILTLLKKYYAHN